MKSHISYLDWIRDFFGFTIILGIHSIRRFPSPLWHDHLFIFQWGLRILSKCVWKTNWRLAALFLACLLDSTGLRSSLQPPGLWRLVCQTAWDIPLWVYSSAYSVIVYLLTFRENRVIEILGKAITPMLIITLLVLILSIFSTSTPESSIVPPQSFSSWNELLSSFVAGYYTMDFIAAIFFSSAVIALVKEKQKDQFNIRLIRNAFLIAVTLLSIIYVGLIAIGHAHAEALAHVPKDRLLAVLGQTIFHEKFQIIIFMIITLSVLSTSMALSLVFSNYLRKYIFKEKLSHGVCLFISVLISFLMSIIGFDKLAILISYATSALYPFLLLVTSTALTKDLYARSSIDSSQTGKIK